MAFSFETGTKLRLAALKGALNLNFDKDHAVGIVVVGRVMCFCEDVNPNFCLLAIKSLYFYTSSALSKPLISYVFVSVNTATICTAIPLSVDTN